NPLSQRRPSHPYIGRTYLLAHVPRSFACSRRHVTRTTPRSERLFRKSRSRAHSETDSARVLGKSFGNGKKNTRRRPTRQSSRLERKTQQASARPSPALSV